MLLERGVQIVDVGRVMFSVVDFHGLLVDVRFERIGGVRKRRKRISHRRSSLSGRATVQPGNRTAGRRKRASRGPRCRASTATSKRFDLGALYWIDSMRSRAILVQYFCSAGTTIRL